MGTEVWAVGMVKDEADIIQGCVERMLCQVERVVVADNMSTDGTWEVLCELANEYPALQVQRDPEVGYYQSDKMSALADQAVRGGASWIVPFDADELWFCDDGRVADLLRDLPDSVYLADAQIFDHVPTARDPIETDPHARMGWRRVEALPLRKVAVRAVPGVSIHQGNHGATIPGVRWPAAVNEALQVRHFPYRSVEQFVSKARNGAAAYAATNLPEHVGKHWRDYGRFLEEGGQEAVAEIFHQWFWSNNPEAEGLVHDPAPPTPGARTVERHASA